MPQSRTRSVGSVGAAATVALGGRMNSLGLSKRDLEELLDELDGVENERGGGTKRKHTRRVFRQVSLELNIIRPGGSTSQIQVCTRNLSSTGLSVLHCSYQHLGTRVTFSLPGIDGKPVNVKGAIVRCSHRRGNIHELGILFDKPIDTKKVISAGIFSDWYSLEQVNPTDLKGSLLYIDESEADRRLIRNHLVDTSMSVATSGTAKEGIERSTEGYDLIMADYHLEQVDGKPITESLREVGVQTPVILITGDVSASTAQRIAKANAQAYLAKPVQKGLLLRALAEFLIVDGARSQLTFACTLPADHPNASLAESFVVDLRAFAESIKNSMEKNDIEGCLTKLAKIKGSASAMGFALIGDMAEKAHISLVASTSIEESSPILNRLTGACKRACGRVG